MHLNAREEVTRLLHALGEENPKAAAELLPLVYDELRRLAESQLGREAYERTLQPTALVHEVYMRLVGEEDRPIWDNRGHFFGSAARAMRRILVERARGRQRIKRGGGRQRVELNEEMLRQEPEPEQVLTLESALQRLERLHARAGEVVMLRYFAGLTIEETARAMGLSAATVKEDWAFARAWLKREIERLHRAEDETPEVGSGC
jgi:RNA polymerase sigma factor (TIGR02999 family)